MWHVSFSVLFHLAWCPQVPSMLLAAAEFPSISWWNVPSLSPYQVVSFMAGIEVYTASVSFLGINNILLSKPGVSTPPPTSAPQWHFKLSCHSPAGALSLRLTHSVWKILSSTPSHSLFSHSYSQHLPDPIGVFMPPAFLKICAKVRVTMGLSPLDTLGNVTSSWEGHVDLIDICHLPAPSLPSCDSPWVLHPALHHRVTDLDMQLTCVCVCVCVSVRTDICV